MDFFAVTSSSSVYRIDLDPDIQAELKASFQEQSDYLLNEDLTVVSLTGGNFSPDESEVLEIEPFDLPENIFDATQNAVGWEALSSRERDVAEVCCVFGYDKQAETLIFQVLQKHQRILPGRFSLLLNGNTFIRIQSPGLVFGTTPHAIYVEGRLRFKSMWWVRQIFDISGFYRAATEKDVEAFVEHPRILVEDVNELRLRAGQWVRTRIAFILDSGILDRYSPEALAADAERFDVPLMVEAGGENDPLGAKLKIPLKPAALRSVLKFLEEEYYEGPITGRKYEANSKRQKD